MTLNVHSLSYPAAREAYTAKPPEGTGWTLTGVPCRRIRPPTSAELLEGANPGALVRSGEREPGHQQCRVDLANSGLIALELPSVVFHGHVGCAPWQSLHALGCGAAPAMSSADGATITVLLRAPDLAAGAPRRLTIDCSLPGLERIRASECQDNLPLPHAGTLERWVRFESADVPAAPELLVALANDAAADDEGLDQAVAAWIQQHFDFIGTIESLAKRVKRSPVNGVPRDDVHKLLLTATGWLPSDYSAERLSRAADLIRVAKHRTNDGYIWQLKRNDQPLKAVNGRPVETVDPELLAFARQIQATRELHPTRIKQKREQAEQAKRAAAEQAAVMRVFGSAEVQGWLRDEGYFQYHADAEARRARSSGQYGEAFIPLSLRSEPSAGDLPGTRYATADWWQDGPGLSPQERYKRVVMRVIEGKQVAA